MRLTRRDGGFTLIELMVGLAVIAILMMLALPTFSQFMTNARARNTAESLMNGIRLAQVEAIRRNRIIEFEVNPAVGWIIRDPAPAPLGGIVQQEPFSDASAALVVQPRPVGTVMLTFSGIGQYLLVNPTDLSPAVEAIRVESTAAPKRYRVVANPALGIGLRICDMDFAHPAQPDGCSVAAAAI